MILMDENPGSRIAAGGEHKHTINTEIYEVATIPNQTIK